MEYESTILKRLIETYGVVGNPRYISEIIKEFIVRGKECFPNLFTYQADWLAHIDEFGLKPSYTVSYTGQSIYAPNTLEKPVKSAILKGNTLVNLLTYFMPNVDYMDGQYRIRFSNVDNFDKITIVNKNSKTIKFSYFSNGWQEYEIPAFNNVLVEIPKETNEYNIFALDTFGWDSTNYREAIDNIVLLHGDYVNVDIPYFEGMQSVKMPVLTTTNEDGTKTNILTTPEDLELRGIGDVKDELNLLTGELIQRASEFIIDKNTSITKYQDIEGFNTTGYYVNLPSNFVLSTTDFICNSLPKGMPDKIQPNMEPVDEEGIVVNAGYIKFRVSNEKGANVEDFKKYLEINPIKLIIPLVEKSVKTVDLTILDQNGQNVKQLMSFNGGTHFNTGSSEGSPLPTVSVSVETDLEETLKVCSLEGNTM